MGDDFQYSNAHSNFRSLDKLIKYFNEKYSDQMVLQYSTPSAYVDAVNAETDIFGEWPTKYDDMFPYSDRTTAYWTGYFTSRANAKEYIRRGSHNLMASNKLYAFEIINQ